MNDSRHHFQRIELHELYRRATGNRTSHGAVIWAAGVLGLDERTIRRWLTGDARAPARQLAQLRVAARASEIRRSRESGTGLWERLRSIFGAGFNDRVAEAAAERERERLAAQTRANDAFRRADRRVRYQLGGDAYAPTAWSPSDGREAPRDPELRPSLPTVRTGRPRR